MGGLQSWKAEGHRTLDEKREEEIILPTISILPEVEPPDSLSVALSQTRNFLPNFLRFPWGAMSGVVQKPSANSCADLLPEGRKD